MQWDKGIGKAFVDLAQRVCSEDTSSNPDGWSKENPLYGHCAVAALLVQDVLGGEIVRISLEDTPEFANLKSHYFNLLENGEKVDITRGQFGEYVPAVNETEARTRDQILAYPDTEKRYRLFKKRFEKLLYSKYGSI